MNLDSWGFLISLITVLASGVSSYVGIRIGQAENKKEIEFLKETIGDLKKSILRLEDKLFK